jgi:sulfite exporter TauE/SafE
MILWHRFSVLMVAPNQACLMGAATGLAFGITTILMIFFKIILPAELNYDSIESDRI